MLPTACSFPAFRPAGTTRQRSRPLVFKHTGHNSINDHHLHEIDLSVPIPVSNAGMSPPIRHRFRPADRIDCADDKPAGSAIPRQKLQRTSRAAPAVPANRTRRLPAGRPSPRSPMVFPPAGFPTAWLQIFRIIWVAAVHFQAPVIHPTPAAQL